jgi:hypothetical protein
MNPHPTSRPRCQRSSQLLLLAVLPLVLVLVSCAQRNLLRVHNVYQAEFQQHLAASATPAPAEAAFPRTLEAIEHFRTRHPNREDALKHLAVLEAMIQLQAGNYGLAQAVAAHAEALPGSLIDRNQKLRRDALFLDALRLDPGLIEAFQMIHGDLPKEEERLEQCGDALAVLARTHHGVDGDDGAVYIASVAANCYLHALEQAVLLTTGTSENRARLIRQAEMKYGTAAMQALAPHLSEREMNASHADLKRLAAESHRYRYVRFYHIAKQVRDGNTPDL